MWVKVGMWATEDKDDVDLDWHFRRVTVIFVSPVHDALPDHRYIVCLSLCIAINTIISNIMVGISFWKISEGETSVGASWQCRKDSTYNSMKAHYILNSKFHLCSLQLPGIFRKSEPLRLQNPFNSWKITRNRPHRNLQKQLKIVLFRTAFLDA